MENLQRVWSVAFPLSLLLLSLVGGRVKCAPQCSGGGVSYAPHDRYCDMFYKCEEGQLREGICPDGLVFDDRAPSDTLRCDFPFGVDCRGREALQPPQSKDPRCPRLYGQFADQDCSRFFKCAEGRPYNFACPEGLAYDEYNGLCDWPDRVDGCDAEAMLGFRCPATSPEDSAEPILYAHTSDCRKHFVCVLNERGERKPRLLACDPGLVFDPETSLCKEPELVPACRDYYKGWDAQQWRNVYGKR